MADGKALALGARFALGPNQLGYCGRGTAPEKFKECIATGECDGVAGEFRKFIVFYPYLKTIAKITGLGAFSYKVIEAYWLGNNELKKAGQKDYRTLLQNFKRQGVPDWLISELAGKKPKVFVPFHLFQILHVGVGRASGTVPFNLESVNNCMVKWGKVLRVVEKKKEAVVKLALLKKVKGGRLRLAEARKVVDYSPRLVPDLKVGEMVAVHWKMIGKRLEVKEVENLQFWTERVLATVEAVV